MEYPSPSKDKPMSFWASPSSQLDNFGSLDGFVRPDDPFNNFSENFDTFAGCDQMLASFALSAGYAPYGEVAQISINGGERVPFPTTSLPVNFADENGRDVRRPLAEKMLKALSLFKDSSGAGILAQVWVPIKEGDKYILSTCEQPYLLDHMLAGYREVSRGFTFSVEGNFAGLPGRVFTSKVSEWTSNVAHYNKGEYLRIDHALSHQVRGSIAVPVFEDEKSCCAVLELVTVKEKSDFNAEMNHVCHALQTVNLKSAAPPRLYKQCLSQNQMAALAEITDVLRAVCHAHRLPVALTWMPLTINSSEKRILCIETDSSYVNDREMQGFVEACGEHHLEEGQGIAGKALQSNHPFFFPDIKEYHISVYPLVHHARKYALNAAVAIRLRSTYTGENDYILEFFLPVNMKGSTEQQLLLNNLSTTMQRICRSLRTVSDAELSGVGGSERDLDESTLPFGSEQKYEGGSSTPGDQISVNGNASTDQTVGGSRRQSEKKRSTAEKHVSLSVLRKYFSGSLKDAAKAIGVCPTTLKRICRQHGISKWPSRKINKVSRSLKKIQTVIDSVHGVQGGLKFDRNIDLDADDAPLSSRFNNENPALKVEDELRSSDGIFGEDGSDSLKTVAMAAGDDSSSGRTESSNGSMMNDSSSSSPSFRGRKNPKPETLFGNEGSKLTIKATYKDDTVRFKYEPSCGWFQLYEEVAKRFKIQTGTFQLKYKDDEEEWVLLVCESDWNECLEILDFLGTRTVKFLVRDATFAMGSSGGSNCFLMGSS